MKTQITRFSYLQNLKIAAILYFVLGLLYIPIGLLMVAGGPGRGQGGAIAFFFMPVIMPILGTIFVTVFIGVYNLIAKFVGGIEFTLEQKDV
jgi:hypothetical protein